MLMTSTDIQLFSQDQQDAALTKTSEGCKTGNLEFVQSAFAGLFLTKGPGSLQLSAWLGNAVANGHADVSTFLFENGAQMDQNLAGVAAQVKVNSAGFAVFEVLFEHGLDLDASLEILLSSYVIENLPLIEYLLTEGANPNCFDDFGDVPFASYEDHTAIETLIRNGAEKRLRTSKARRLWTMLGIRI